MPGIIAAMARGKVREKREAREKTGVGRTCLTGLAKRLAHLAIGVGLGVTLTHAHACYCAGRDGGRRGREG
jgi:hypothetical protein